MGVSLMLYHKQSKGNYIFDVARSGRIARERATTVSQPLQDARTQQSIF
jgi:hypothetical protein